MGLLHTKCEWSKNHDDANDDQHDRQHGEVRRIQKIVEVGDIILDISSYSNQTNAGTKQQKLKEVKTFLQETHCSIFTLETLKS